LSLSSAEQKILKNFRTNGQFAVKEILARNEMGKEYYSKHLVRLSKTGILVSPFRGKLAFALPRFKGFTDANSFDE